MGKRKVQAPILSSWSEIHVEAMVLADTAYYRHYKIMQNWIMINLFLYLMSLSYFQECRHFHMLIIETEELEICHFKYFIILHRFIRWNKLAAKTPICVSSDAWIILTNYVSVIWWPVWGNWIKYVLSALIVLLVLKCALQRVVRRLWYLLIDASSLK